MPPRKKKKKANPPRMGPVAIATILTLRKQGKKLEVRRLSAIQADCGPFARPRV
jgi:hypothetical protein